MITGIYIIRNKINNKIYVGSAIDVKKRWRDHKWYLKENKHHNPHLQASYNKYELENFKFILELECNKINLIGNETNVIQKYDSKNRNYGYNINDPRQIFTGHKCSDELKQKSSERMVGENNPMYGKIGEEHPKYQYKLSE
nr:GIY-YIG nuclease family protein [Bacteroidales bacterium]